MTRTTYNPKGVSEKPMPLRLMSDECAQVKEAVQKSGIRQSVLLRAAHNAGMPIVLERIARGEDVSSPSSIPPVEGASDGEATLLPVTFSSPTGQD